MIEQLAVIGLGALAMFGGVLLAREWTRPRDETVATVRYRLRYGGGRP